MKKILATLGIGGALALGGVDASVLEETPIDRAMTLKEEHVTVKQTGNVVEASLPWKDQPGFKIKYDMEEPTLSEKTADKRDKQAIIEQVGTDAFKIDIILNKKPATNIFCYTIEGADDYDFFYQPPLTQAEIDEGAERPEEIVGSYAVYHKTLKNHIVGQTNYETGKVAHIPYPYIWSLDATSTTKHRAEDFSIENGQMCVTVAQKDLNTMEYPVRIDPTFGYTSAGGTNWAMEDRLPGGEFGTSGDAGTLEKLSVYTDGDTGNDREIQGALYNAKGDHSLVTNGVTDTLTINDASADWRDLPFSTSPSVSASTAYTLTAGSEDQGAFFGRYDSGKAAGNWLFANALVWNAGDGAPTVPDPYGADSSFDGYGFSIYATYEVASESPAPRQSIIWFE